MNAEHRIRVCRRLELVARAAASGFPSRCGRSDGRPVGWLPVALRWRNGKKRPGGVRVRPGPTAGAVWRPQFHLHFHAPGSDRAPAATTPAVGTSVWIHLQRRFALNLHQIGVRYRIAGRDFWRAGPTSPGSRADLTRAPRPDAAALPPPRSSRPAAAPITSPAEYLRRRRRIVEPSLPSGLCAEASSGPRILFRADPPIRKPEAFRPFPPVFRGRVARPRHPGPVSSASAATAGRPPELVWRRSLRAPTEIAGREQRPDLRGSPSRASGLPAFEAQAAPETPPRPAPAAAPLPAKPDPAFLDRLTDDVIRRVERRVRIERERHGI